jgi:thiol-disulfide isomerase/thioredoxin
MTIRSIALAAIAVATAAGALAFGSRTLEARDDQPRPAPEFVGLDRWVNSPPLTMASLRGKVVLVDFWTYSCINCLNALPYVQAWDARYKSQGLVVVGVHTPEFGYEKSDKNLDAAIARLKIRHAVAQDNGYATWRAFDNEYWPAVYLIDRQGRIVYSHVGEGDYAQIDKRIQALLSQPANAASGVTPSEPGSLQH